MSRLSIRWRITIGSLLLAILFFGAGAFAFTNQIASILSSTAETLLEHDAAPFVIHIKNGATKIDEPGHAQLLAIIDPAGVIQQSTLPPALSSRLPELERFYGEPRQITVGEDRYLALSEFVDTDRGQWTIVSARNLESSGLLQDRIAGALFVGALILILGFGIASWLLTGAALRPVAKMRQQARELSRNTSSANLPVGPARDELSELATTLNEFIDIQRATAARERQLVSDASHELRSPLAVLMAQLELAHLSSGDADALETQIRAAEHSARRVSDLATRLLELSEAEADSVRASSTWSELASEVGAAADRARLAGFRSLVTVDFDVHGDVQDARYPLDVWRLGRILDNLWGNSIAAMPHGGQLTLSLNQRVDAIELLVVDNGPGIPEKFLPKAFDRFARPDESRTKTTGGSGLGLAIVSAIVKAAGGTVTLSNVETMNRDSGGACAEVIVPEIRTVPE